MRVLPQFPEELLEELFEIFPQYQKNYPGPFHDGPPSFHSVLMGFTQYFGAHKESFSESQIRAFAALINSAVAGGGSLENAFSTCLLEHLGQIRSLKILRPHLSELARSNAR